MPFPSLQNFLDIPLWVVLALLIPTPSLQHHCSWGSTPTSPPVNFSFCILLGRAGCLTVIHGFTSFIPLNATTASTLSSECPGPTELSLRHLFLWNSELSMIKLLYLRPPSHPPPLPTAQLHMQHGGRSILQGSVTGPTTCPGPTSTL